MKPEQESEIGTFYDLRGERKLKSRSRQYGSQQINFFLTSPYKKATMAYKTKAENLKNNNAFSIFAVEQDATQFFLQNWAIRFLVMIYQKNLLPRPMS